MNHGHPIGGVKQVQRLFSPAEGEHKNAFPKVRSLQLVACMRLAVSNNRLVRQLIIIIMAALVVGAGIVYSGCRTFEKQASVIGPSTHDAGFGGFPMLGPKDDFRHLFKPYDLVKLNVLGANYCENLLDMRVNAVSYSHRDFDKSTSSAWNLQYPDDGARLLEGLAWEDEYSPVVRLEFARRLVKGLISGRIPGTFTDYFFRHLNGGKTFLILADPRDKEGRIDLANWGDRIENALKIGFRVQRKGVWVGMDAHTYQDAPGSPVTSGQARSARLWNESPVVVRRQYTADNATVDFTGRYWLSDEDRPLEYAFTANRDERLQVVVGETGKPVPFLGNPAVPTTLHLPDRKTRFSSDTGGDRVFDHPDFHYLILSKPSDRGITVGYSKALLVIWDSEPERVEVLADKGYGEVRVTYAGPSGKVWLYPYYHFDNPDIESIFRSAEQFLDKGTLMQNGYPSPQFINAIPAGLAAGAYLLTRYNDPMAFTARVNAARLVNRLFAAEDEGEKLTRVFFTVKAAAWMAKTERELGNAAGVQHYTALVDHSMARMCSPQSAYDGTGWPNGWTHFCSMKACWLAYDATGNKKYLDAYERALQVYTIDAKGIYRHGKKMDAPGGFETYSGSLPLGVWGNAGKLDWVNQLINLNVPNGWKGVPDPARPLCDVWSDAGAGPWAQDDANPEYVGFSLRGAHLPQPKKYILPVGAFPSYDSNGVVQATYQPILSNPFFLPGTGPVRVVEAKDIGKQSVKVVSTVVVPGTAVERKTLVHKTGTVAQNGRTCTGQDDPLVYRFDARGADGLGLDLRIRGDGYRVEVSPDGKQWYERLDTWDDKFADQSVDLSFLAGSRDELVRLKTIVPPNDVKLLVEGSGSVVQRNHCRYVTRGGSVIYQLNLPQVTGCWLELILGNGYRVDFSSDGKTWQPGVSSTDALGGSGKGAPDAAWIRMLDVSPCLHNGPRVFLRIADTGDASAFSGCTAFLRRLTAYGYFRSGNLWVKLSNVSALTGHSFTLERLTIRKWKR